jgi:hypothetical protein
MTDEEPPIREEDDSTFCDGRLSETTGVEDEREEIEAVRTGTRRKYSRVTAAKR